MRHLDTIKSVKGGRTPRLSPKLLIPDATLTNGTIQWANVKFEEAPSAYEQVWTFKMSGDVQPSVSNSYVLTYDLSSSPVQLSFDAPLQGFLNIRQKTTYNANRYVRFSYNNTTRQVQFVIRLPCDARIEKPTPIFLEVFLYNQVEPTPARIVIEDISQDQSSSACPTENSVIYDYVNYQNGTSSIRISPCNADAYITPITVDVGGNIPVGQLLQVFFRFESQETVPDNTLILSSNGTSSTFSNLLFVDFVFGFDTIYNGYVFRWDGSRWQQTDGSEVLVNNLWNDPEETYLSTRCVSTNAENYFLRAFNVLDVLYKGSCSENPPSEATIYCASIPQDQQLAFIPYVPLTNFQLRIQNNDGTTFTSFFFQELNPFEQTKFTFDGSVWLQVEPPQSQT